MTHSEKNGHKQEHPEAQYCCERCQIFWTCEMKWYRGERHERSTCCAQCDYYPLCPKKHPKQH
ncbi:MAG: hypothetical protein PHO30_01915 [Candidatus Omnitrophica bacterium]|nr:hypothetical protein [Candidatus Omnitrophota bacterium]